MKIQQNYLNFKVVPVVRSDSIDFDQPSGAQAPERWSKYTTGLKSYQICGQSLRLKTRVIFFCSFDILCKDQATFVIFWIEIGRVIDPGVHEAGAHAHQPDAVLPQMRF